MSFKNWVASVRPHGVYAMTWLGGKGMEYMHRFLMVVPKGKCIDHRNNEPLHNWFGNIRSASRRQNVYNTRIGTKNRSGYKGVHWAKAEKKFATQISHNGVTRHLAYGDSAYDLHLIYRAEEIRLRGEFAHNSVGRKKDYGEFRGGVMLEDRFEEATCIRCDCGLSEHTCWRLEVQQGASAASKSKSAVMKTATPPSQPQVDRFQYGRKSCYRSLPR